MAKRRTILDLLDDLEPEVREAFEQSIARLTSDVQIAALVAAIEAGDITRAMRILAIEAEYFAPLDRMMREAYDAGGEFAMAEFLRQARNQGANTSRFFFDPSNSRATEYARKWSSDRVTGPVGLVEEIRANVRRVIGEGLEAGTSAQTIALDLVGRYDKKLGRRVGGVVGLTDGLIRQAESVYAILTDPEGPRSYFVKDAKTGRWKPRYKGTDRRFDSTIIRAIKAGKPIPAGDARKITALYRSRLLKQRGEMIARTEIIRSLHAAQNDGLMQLVDRGKVRADQITREWDSAEDSATRDTHRAMDGQVKGPQEPFASPSGALLMYPGDTSLGAPAEEVINCFAPWTMIGLAGLQGSVESAYSGDLVEIVCGDGVDLAVTPNHPVLTGRGWVPAGDVVEGDQLIQSRLADFGDAATEPHVSNWYARAKQLHEAAQRTGSVRRARRGIVNLHGHMPGHDVDVVTMPRHLRDALNATTDEVFGDFAFTVADVTAGSGSIFRGLLLARGRSLPRSNNAVRRFRSGVATLLRHESGRPPVAIGDVGAGDAEIVEARIHDATPYAERVGDSEHCVPVIKHCLHARQQRGSLGSVSGFRGIGNTCSAMMGRQAKVNQALARGLMSNTQGSAHVGHKGAVGVQFADIVLDGCASSGCHASGVHVLSNGDPSFPQNLIGSGIGCSDTFGGFPDVQSGGVDVNDLGVSLFASVGVKSVRRRQYSGPVYDFQSVNGMLLANGLIVHNCRCVLRPSIDFIAGLGPGD